MGFRRDNASTTEQERMRASIEDALKKTFRPELLNRIDEIVIFEPLSRDQVKQIVELMVGEVRDRLGERGIGIEMAESAKDWLAKEGYDPQYGARPLRRAVQRYVENPLSNRILAGDFKEGDAVKVWATHEGLNYALVEAAIEAPV